MNTPNMSSEQKEPKAFLTTGIVYEMTLNAPDRGQYFNKETRATKCVEHYSTILELMRPYADYTFYPELSQIRNSNPEKQHYCRWHYHGFIKFKDNLALAQWLVHSQYKLSKTVDYQINAYREEYWNKYCTKQEEIMKPLCKSLNIPYILSSTKPRFKSIL